MFEALGSEPHYRDPQTSVIFGDIFEAAFLRDVFVRQDATLMGGGPLPPSLAPRVGKWMNVQLDDAPMDLYSPAFPPKTETRFALAHASFLPDASTLQAILISDSCVAATALAQGRQRRSVGGRLLFAPLAAVSAEEWKQLVDAEDFERFPLPDDPRLPTGSVAEFRRCFMADARAVKAHLDGRIASLGDELAKELEVHWGAYAARRGPRAYGRSALKLASLLSGGGTPGSPEEHAAGAVAATLDLAWQIEGTDLEAVSEAEESVRLAGGDAAELTPPIVERMVARLRDLAARATTAADELDAHLVHAGPRRYRRITRRR